MARCRSSVGPRELLSLVAGIRPAPSTSPFGESYEQAAKRELKEETGISATPTYLGKFSYQVPPENESVAVFSCRSDDHNGIDPAESFEASFYSTEKLNAITASEVAAPSFRRGLGDTKRNDASRIACSL